MGYKFPSCDHANIKHRLDIHLHCNWIDNSTTRELLFVEYCVFLNNFVHFVVCILKTLLPQLFEKVPFFRC